MPARQRRAKLPKLPQLPGAPRVSGLKTPRIPRQRRTAESQRPYPPPPPGYLYSLGEWVVEDYLTRVKGWQKIGGGEEDTPVPIPQRSFYQQVRVKALSIFVNTDETRIDFLIPQGTGGSMRAIALDPYDTFTHPDASLDLLKREVLEKQQGIRLVWLENARLEAGDYQIIEDGLRGVDTSGRAHGA
jgi:hypothetical protein